MYNKNVHCSLSRLDTASADSAPHPSCLSASYSPRTAIQPPSLFRDQKMLTAAGLVLRPPEPAPPQDRRRRRQRHHRGQRIRRTASGRSFSFLSLSLSWFVMEGYNFLACLPWQWPSPAFPLCFLSLGARCSDVRIVFAGNQSRFWLNDQRAGLNDRVESAGASRLWPTCRSVSEDILGLSCSIILFA